MLVQRATVDVAVVGGGAIGLAVAWRAAQRGARISVFDTGALGAGASAVAAGMLAPVSEVQFGAAGEALLELGQESARRWPAFAAELQRAAGLDVGLRATGTLVLARDADEAEELERELDYRRRLGLSVTRLRASQARALEPALAPTVRIALHAPDDHCVDPRALTQALLEAARGERVTLRPGSPVAHVLLSPDQRRARGVQLSDGERIRAEQVVVAAGAWSGGLEGIPASARVPVRPVKGQIMRLRDSTGPGLLGRVLRYPGGYLVPRGDGRYVLGATDEEQGFDTEVTAGGILGLLREARELVPGVEDLVVEEARAGLRPGTPDNAPVIGRGSIGGLLWATGHHRNGILLAPVTADLLAGALAGEPPEGLLARFSPERFGAQVPA